MKRKCDHCRGKGGFEPTGRRVVAGQFVTCTHCRGKGFWRAGQKPKRKKPGN